MTPTSAAPWPVVVTLEPANSLHAFEHPEPVITIPCPSQMSDDPLTWLELLGQR
jgi:hypothetical protein